MPDGATCSNNQILKRTGANDWDCAADASGSVSSNSLDFDEFVASMSLDTFTDVTFGTQQYSFNLNSTGDFVIEDNGAIHTIFTDTGNVGIGTRTPQAELQINSSGTSSLYLSQDSVAHGMTSIAPANTFGVFQNNSLTDGILDIIGISDANNEALRLNGVIGNTNPTDTTCAVCIIGSKENGGTGNQALGSLETVFGVSNYISTRLFSILGRGFTGVLTNTPTTVFEVQGTASASYFLTGNTLQVGGFSSAAYSRFGTDVTTNSNYISTTNDVLVSGDLQVIGTGSFNYASTSLGYFGGGLTDCDGGTSKLLWSDTGLFSCGTDDDVPESGDFTNLTGGLAIDNTAGTLDFDSTEFTGNRNWSDGTSDSTFTWTFDLNAGTDIGINFGDNRLLISQNVSTSSNFEAVGYASASKTFGSGLTDCDDPGQTLAWTASGSSNGKFSCQSRAGYTLEFNHANTTPLTDNTNLYFGNTILAATTANNVFFVNVPKAGVVTGAACQELATPGTSEAGILAIQVAGTPAGTISAAVDLSASGNEYTNFAMYIPVNQGDNLSILFDPPTWATNPSNLNINCVVYIEND